MTEHITIWHILRKKRSIRSEPQNIGFAFDALTPKLSCLIRFRRLIFQTNVVEPVNLGQISLVVTCTAVCTCHHLKFPAKNWNLRWRSTGKFKGFFIHEQRKIYTWLYVPVTGHVTIGHILRKSKSMRSEPQNIGLAFDVLTPKLSCLIRFSHLIFETNVVERVNSGQISLVVTCTTVCTCHHLIFPAKNWNF